MAAWVSRIVSLKLMSWLGGSSPRLELGRLLPSPALFKKGRACVLCRIGCLSGDRHSNHPLEVQAVRNTAIHDLILHRGEGQVQIEDDAIYNNLVTFED